MNYIQTESVSKYLKLIDEIGWSSGWGPYDTPIISRLNNLNDDQYEAKILVYLALYFEGEDSVIPLYDQLKPLPGFERLKWATDELLLQSNINGNISILLDVLLGDSPVLKYFKEEVLNFWLSSQSRIRNLSNPEPVNPSRNLSTHHAVRLLAKLAKSYPFPVFIYWSLIKHRLEDEQLSCSDFMNIYMRKKKHSFQLTDDGVLEVGISSNLNLNSAKVVIGDRCNNFANSDYNLKKADDFYELYKKYLNALSCNLVFAKCASKLTRVDKLYSKEFEFKLGEIISPLRGSSQTKNMILSNIIKSFKSNKDLSKYEKILDYYTGVKNPKIQSTGKLVKAYEKIPANNKFWRQFDGMAKTSEDDLTGLLHSQLLLQPISSSEIIKTNLDTGMCFFPFIVNGEAGMGKTIAIHQLAVKYISELESMAELHNLTEINCLPLPIFIKAKRIDFSPSNIEWIDIVIDAQYESFPDMVYYISREEMSSLFATWSEFSVIHNSHLTYFIDALDECDNKDEVQEIIRNTTLIDTMSYSQKPMVFASTRPSHYQQVRQALLSTKHLIANMMPGDYYSENELSQDMPNMLCDAWGITHEPAISLQNRLDKYKDLISHPLFVGWICYLILNDELVSDNDFESQHVEVSRNNVLNKIIEIGISSTFDRKDVSIAYNPEIDSKIRAFVAISFHFALKKPHDVFGKMKNLLDLNLSKDEKEIICNDCGILFLTGKNIEWTHNTIPELVYADYYNEFGIEKHLGPLKVSEPVLSRIAQKKIGEYADYDSSKVNIWFKYLDSDLFSEKVENILFSIESKDGIVEYTNRPIIGLDDDKEFVVISEGRENVEIAIAELYVANMNTSDRFRLSSYKFRADDGIREQIYDNSDHIFGKDLISFGNEYWTEDNSNVLVIRGNLVEIEKLELERVSSSDSFVSLIEYLRNMMFSMISEFENKNLSQLKISMLTNPEYLEARITEVVKRLVNSRGRNYQNIFDISAMGYPTIPDGDNFDEGEMNPFSWFPELKTGKLTFVDSAKIQGFSGIRKWVVSLSFGKLFGEGWEQQVEYIWELLESEICYEQTAYDNAEPCNLISSLMFDNDLNAWKDDSEHEGHVVSKDMRNILPIEEFDVRALMLFPFVHESLVIIESGVDPYSPKYNCSCEQLGEKFGMTRYWKPFELIKNYSSNLLR